jgi:hypothetical protein
MCDQNVTLDTLEDIMERLKAKMSDIFPGDGAFWMQAEFELCLWVKSRHSALFR